MKKSIFSDNSFLWLGPFFLGLSLLTRFLLDSGFQHTEVGFYFYQTLGWISAAALVGLIIYFTKIAISPKDKILRTAAVFSIVVSISMLLYLFNWF